jgi:sensor histidine kinase YesM
VVSDIACSCGFASRQSCQEIFATILTKEYSDFRYAKAHRLTVDAYCLQHPELYMVSPKSFVAHLTGMCCAMAYGNDPHLRRLLQQWLNGKKQLAKPPMLAHYGFYIYFIILLLNHALEYYRRFQDEQLSASQLKAELAQAQLQALKMQLHPHFLFNTLNAIVVLIEEDPKAARAMLGQLSDLLRLTLDNVETQEVPLRQELEFLDQYLRIQQTRFGERLAIKKNIDPATIEASVPYLILQPLVENAIRHGVESVPGPAVIEISSSRQDGMLELRVRDTGPGLTNDSYTLSKRGVGLANTRGRLQRLYGERHRVELNNAEGGGLQATMLIPFQGNQKN